MREFSVTSIEGVVVKGFCKPDDNIFVFKIGDQSITFDFTQLEIMRNGTADLSDSYLKKNGK